MTKMDDYSGDPWLTEILRFLRFINYVIVSVPVLVVVVKPAISDLLTAAKEADQRTRNDDGSHQANVCIVYNQFITGVEPLCWIDEEFLRSVENKDRLGVARHEQHYRLEM